MFKRSNLIVLISLCVFGSAVGAVGGWFLGSMFKPVPELNNDVYFDKPVEYSTKHEATAKLLKVLNVTDEEFDKVDVTTAIGANGITVADIAEAVTYRVYKHSKIKTYSENTAESDAGIMINMQYTDSTYIKVNDCYFKENISTSDTVRFGERYTNFDHKSTNNPLIPKKPHENEIEYYRLIDKNVPDSREVNFSSATKQKYFVNVPEGDESGAKSFSTFFGISAFGVFNYEYKSQYALKDSSGNFASVSIMNSKTHKEEVFDTSMKKTESGYELMLAVGSEACVNFASYAATTTRDQTKLAKMAKKPEYLKLGLRITTDKNLNILSIADVEFYNVFSAMGMTVPTYATSDILFSYDDSITLPTLSDVTPKGLK